METRKSLPGQVCLISGGLGDIGRAIALELARRGADVGACDILEASQAEGLLGELRDLGGKARYDRVDVADAGAVRAWLASVEADLGLPTLLIPNAATVTLADALTITPDQWSCQLRVNLDGGFHMAQAGALRLLAHQKPGRIVFVGSWAAHVPHVHIPAYSAAKAGLRMLCRCLALQLAPYNILVNEVAPGYVEAGLSGKIFEADLERKRRAIQQVPVRALIAPEEVAAQVAYLCEPDNRHMTGSTLLMDGGLSLLSTG